MDIEILYQDDVMLAVNKPAGMLSVPGKNPDDGLSLIDHLKPKHPDARIVHRLDMATSGVMVVANGTPSLRVLGKQFEERTTSKTYIARVWGQVQSDAGLIDEPLICDYPNRPLQKICYEHGKPSQTHWRVMERRTDSTILELKPITGRSHQLRVHCQFMGHPIIGDNFYASGNALAASDRLELYAHQLTVHHPVTNRPMTFTAPCVYVRA